MLKKISLVIFSFIISSITIAQEVRINAANKYFNANRFVDAKTIYEELCLKDKIDINTNAQVYRNAVISGLKVRDYWFVLKVYQGFMNSTELTIDDLYQYFMLENYIGRYEKFDEIFDMHLYKIGIGPKKDLMKKYQQEKPWLNLMKDTLGSEIVFLDINSGKGDFGPVLHPDGMSFSSFRKQLGQPSVYDNSGYIDQYFMSRETKKIKELKPILEKRHDGAAYYDAENKIWYYSKNMNTLKNDQLTKIGIYSYDEKTKKELAFPYNNIEYFVAQPFVTKDGKTMYFSSDMPGSLGKADIWKSDFIDGNWSKPINLGPTINTSEDEMFPYMQENNFYFSSVGHLGLGGLDIFLSKIKNNQFEKPLNMGYPLNSYGDDLSLVLLDDQETGYYTNNRKDFKFIDNIYRIKLLNVSIPFRATVMANTKEREIIKGMKVIVKDETNTTIDTLETDDAGMIDFKAKKDKKYTFYLGNDDYEDHQELFSTNNITNSDTVKRDILLNPKAIVVTTIIKDSKTNELLANTTVQFINKTSGEIKEFVSDQNGQISSTFPRNMEYDLLVTKKNYIDKTEHISTASKEKQLTKEVLIEKLTAGTTFKIENVFYDLGKATLRPESKAELDKLAEFLIKNDNVKVELSSHTDSRGSDASNQKLSQARAQSCVDYLLTKGVNTTNIVAKGYGEKKLVNKCKDGAKCSEEEHQMNRRTEIKILSVK